MCDLSFSIKKSKLARLGGLTEGIAWGSLLLLFPLSRPALAGPGQLDRTFKTTSHPEVMLANLRGKLEVRGWEKSEVQAQCATVSPRVEMSAETLPPSGPAERVQLKAHVLDPLVNGDEETVDCILEVPQGSSVEIRNPQGSVRIELIRGQHTRIDSAGGSVFATDVGGHLTIRTLGGDIEIVRPSGRTEAFSITGTVRFVDPASSDLRGNTNSGKIVYQGSFLPGAEYILSTYSGDIEVRCPSTASFKLTAKTVKGKVDNALSLTPRRRDVSPLASAHSLLGTHNTGNAMVELTSFSGTIRLRQQR